MVDVTVAKAFAIIGDRLKAGKEVTEFEITEFIHKEFDDAGYLYDPYPWCCVNANSADPHYLPSKEKNTAIKKGDWVLIDLWCAKPGHPFADITRVAVADSKPTARQEEVFSVVKAARNAAINLVKERMASGETLRGGEVDSAARKVIEDAGFGEYFIHRTGHSITTALHGEGVNIDALETQEERHIIPGVCFSIEPGIYIPGEFGVRLEVDVLVTPEKEVMVTGGVQDEITCLL